MKPEDITEKQIEQLKEDDYVNFSDLTEHLRECAAAIGRDNFEVAVENRWHTVPSKLKEFRLDTTYRLRQDYEKPYTVKVEEVQKWTVEDLQELFENENHSEFGDFHVRAQFICREIGIENFQYWDEDWDEEWKDTNPSYHVKHHKLTIYRLKPHITLEFTEPHGCPSCSTLLVKIDELEKQVKKLEAIKAIALGL